MKSEFGSGSVLEPAQPAKECNSDLVRLGDSLWGLRTTDVEVSLDSGVEEPALISRRSFLQQAGFCCAGGLALALTTSLAAQQVHAKPFSFESGLTRKPVKGPSAIVWQQWAIVQRAFSGLDFSQVWDCHVHVFGNNKTPVRSSTDFRTWINPQFEKSLMISDAVRRKMLTNAADVTVDDPVMEQTFIDHVVAMASEMPKGYKVMILAFDFTYSLEGERLPKQSMFAVSNAFAAEMAKRYSDRVEWIASVHPYRKDAVEGLRWAKEHGARAVKWLPPAMGIDLTHERCQPAYAAMRDLGLPLLTHVGEERAVKGAHKPEYGHPLHLRAPLNAGCKVIAAHCASLGNSTDLDSTDEYPPSVRNLDLFARLLAEPKYQGLLFGDVSAVTQANRGNVPAEIIAKKDWHERLLFGSDYPLPGVVPLTSLTQLQKQGLITKADIQPLEQLRHANPLAFDFVLKRTLKNKGGEGFAAGVYETRRFFER